MDAVSLPLFHLARSHWPGLVVALGLLCLLVLLAFAAGAAGIGPTAPADGELIGPFRWQQGGSAQA